MLFQLAWEVSTLFARRSRYNFVAGWRSRNSIAIQSWLSWCLFGGWCWWAHAVDAARSASWSTSSVADDVAALINAAAIDNVVTTQTQGLFSLTANAAITVGQGVGQCTNDALAAAARVLAQLIANFVSSSSTNCFHSVVECVDEGRHDFWVTDAVKASQPNDGCTALSSVASCLRAVDQLCNDASIFAAGVVAAAVIAAWNDTGVVATIIAATVDIAAIVGVAASVVAWSGTAGAATVVAAIIARGTAVVSTVLSVARSSTNWSTTIASSVATTGVAAVIVVVTAVVADWAATVD